MQDCLSRLTSFKIGSQAIDHRSMSAEIRGGLKGGGVMATACWLVAEGGGEFFYSTVPQNAKSP